MRIGKFEIGGDEIVMLVFVGVMIWILIGFGRMLSKPIGGTERFKCTEVATRFCQKENIECINQVMRECLGE